MGTSAEWMNIHLHSIHQKHSSGECFFKCWPVLEVWGVICMYKFISFIVEITSFRIETVIYIVTIVLWLI